MADIARRCACPDSRARWATPNRCCSSTIARPTRSGASPAVSSACVPNQQIQLARVPRRDGRRPGTRGHAAGQRRSPQPGGVAPRRERARLLLGQHLGRDHHQRAGAGGGDQRGRDERNRGLAAARVADQQPPHRTIRQEPWEGFLNFRDDSAGQSPARQRARQIRRDLVGGADLRGRELERQSGDGPGARFRELSGRQRPGRAGVRCPLRQESQLRHERALEQHAAAGRRRRREIVGRRMQRPQRVGERRQTEPPQRLKRCQVHGPTRRDRGQRRRADPFQRAARHAGDLGVPRPDPQPRPATRQQRRRDDGRLQQLARAVARRVQRARPPRPGRPSGRRAPSRPARETSARGRSPPRRRPGRPAAAAGKRAGA